MNEFDWWIIEQKTHLESLEILSAQSKDRPWASYFLYDRPMSLGNLASQCRIGHVPFDHCVQDRYFYLDQSKNIEMLVAGGITTQIAWDYDTDSLPNGWQGAVRQSYRDSRKKDSKPNTQVALLAFTADRYRGQGNSGRVLSKMCQMAKQRGYDSCIVPALLPSQFEKKYARMKMEEFATLYKDGSQFYDYWLRLHTRLGAKIIAFNDCSHRFAYTIEDFSQYISSALFTVTGEYVVRLDKDVGLGANHKDMWQLVYVNLEQNVVLFNWGCAWVQYDLNKLNF